MTNDGAGDQGPGKSGQGEETAAAGDGAEAAGSAASDRRQPPAAAKPAAPRRPLTEETPVTALHGVGKRMAERLAKLDIRIVRELLFHLPNRYQDRSRLVPIAELRPGMQVQVEGAVVECRVKFGRGRSMLLCTVADQSGQLVLRFFNASQGHQGRLAPGTRLRLYGEVREGYQSLEMVHPEYRREDELPAGTEATLTPLYPATEGLHQSTLRGLIEQVLAQFPAAGEAPFLRDHWRPGAHLADIDPRPLDQVVRFLHNPPADTDRELLEQGAHPARRRLVVEELLAHHLGLRRLRTHLQARKAVPIHTPGDYAERLLQGLPFQLTAAQNRVIAEILADLRRGQPMQRLLQGDVGSGKTLVAASVLLHCVEAGYQAAVMAPTELLAEQHQRNFAAWLAPLGIEMAWLSGRLKGKARQRTLEAVATGRARVVVGTHALFQQEVTFHDLGLVVIDEQHRFGVHQRLALREKGMSGEHAPHQLIMTATPIPRTLTMTAYADLDVSIIDQLPGGRGEVVTAVVPDTRRDDVMQRVRKACGLEGRQAYWVCTLIDESDSLQAEAAAATAARLREELPDLSVGLVHGRMNAKEKEAEMAAFQAGETRLLVATTVIEVGVDVPNASLMVIENAERLGLAQLHQLRGRVGRGSAASACVLMYRSPLTDIARQRLAILRETRDGFAVAQRDLELRGPGEVLGTRQTGAMQLRVADLARDAGLLPLVEPAARAFMEEHPERVQPLIDRWVPRGEQFGEV